MRQGRYPLEVVRTQRAAAYKQAEFEMVSARAHLFDAEKALAAAQEACKAHAGKRALATMPLTTQSAQALSWSGAYSLRLAADSRKLARLAQEAQTEVASRSRAVRLAEMAFQRAYAERETLERHHERFRLAERKAAEKAEELENEDLAHLWVRG